MKKFNPLRTLVLVFVFTLGFQMVSDAQIRIFNFTDCPIFLKTALNDNCVACDDSGIQFLGANGGVYQQATNPIGCPDDIWLGIKWFTSLPGFGSIGYSFNPTYTCGADVPGLCQGNAINVQWSSAGPGPITIFLTN